MSGFRPGSPVERAVRSVGCPTRSICPLRLCYETPTGALRVSFRASNKTGRNPIPDVGVASIQSADAATSAQALLRAMAEGVPFDTCLVMGGE